MNLKIGINGIVFSNPMTLQLNKLINEHNEEIKTFSNYSLKFIVNTFPFGGSVKHDMLSSGDFLFGRKRNIHKDFCQSSNIKPLNVKKTKFNVTVCQ